MRILGFGILVISMLSAQLVSALTCNNVDASSLELCKEIIGSDLKDDEKNELIAELIYKGGDYPNHDFISKWNSNIKFGATPPENSDVKSNEQIDNAWLKIIAILPSVISDKKLLTPGIGKVFTAYNYNVKNLPTETLYGDCKTEYSLASQENKLTIYLNDNPIGTSALTDFQGSGALNFKANLKLDLVVKIDHYKNYKKCCCRNKRRCCGYCDECRFSRTDYKTHSLILEDTKQAYQYWPVIQPKIKALNKYHDTSVIMLNISNFDTFSIKSGESSFQLNNYYYDVVVTDTIYNVLTLRANKLRNKAAKNLYFEEINNTYKFYVPNDKTCKIEFGSHFHHWQEDCSKLDYSLPELKIDTDKSVYSQNEPIHVELTPKNTLMNVTYGDVSVLAKDHVSFSANPEYNKVTTFLDGRDYQKLIYVKNNDLWNTALNLAVFCGLIYSVFLMISKYWFWI